MKVCIHISSLNFQERSISPVKRPRYLNCGLALDRSVINDKQHLSSSLGTQLNLEPGFLIFKLFFK